MLFSKFLVKCLLLGAAAALVAPEWTEESTSLEQERAIIDSSNMADENTWIFPTATFPIAKLPRSNIAGTPSPIQPGLISTCDAYYFVEAGDYCSAIVSKFGNFTLSQFYTWNPYVFKFLFVYLPE